MSFKKARSYSFISIKANFLFNSFCGNSRARCPNASSIKETDAMRRLAKLIVIRSDFPHSSQTLSYIAFLRYFGMNSA